MESSARSADTAMEGSDDLEELEDAAYEFEDGVQSLGGDEAKEITTPTGGRKRKKDRHGVLDARGKKYRRAVSGKKWCLAHGKYEPVENFPSGSGQCAIGRRILQNLRKAAIAQGMQKWLDKVLADPKLLVKTVAAY